MFCLPLGYTALQNTSAKAAIKIVQFEGREIKQPSVGEI